MAISCKSCGANDAAVNSGGSITCKYCGGLIEAGWFDEWNPFAKKTTVAYGINTRAFVVSGLTLFTALSVVAVLFDIPRWFSSDFAIAIWSVINPLCVLVWAFMLHPARRSPALITLVILVNFLPMLVEVLLFSPRFLSKDDFWGLSGLFAGCMVAGYLIGAILNNLRKNFPVIRDLFLGK